MLSNSLIPLYALGQGQDAPMQIACAQQELGNLATQPASTNYFVQTNNSIQWRVFYDYTWKNFNAARKFNLSVKDGFKATAMDIFENTLRSLGTLLFVSSAEEANIIIVMAYAKMGHLYQGEYKDKIVIAFSGESFTYAPNLVTLSFGSSHMTEKNYLRLPLYVLRFREELSPLFKRPQELLSKHKNFCGFLVSNGHQTKGLDGVMARDRVFQSLSNYKQVISGGGHLNNIGGAISYSQTKTWFSQFKFVICYENSSHDGYMTEKVFNAYFAGAVPIYYADRSVLKDINPKAIIFAPDFESEEALIEYIKKVDQDDALYKSIWDQPLMIDPYYSYDAYQRRLQEKITEFIIPRILDKQE